MMALDPKSLPASLQNLFHWQPWHIPDPGPEIWSIIHSLPEHGQQAALKAVAEAQAKMHDLRASTIREIGNIAAGKTR